MAFDNYDIIYLITNIFGTYIVFIFMNIFFKRNNTDKKIEFGSYILYYLLIGLVHISFNNPLINLICNILLFLMLSMNYTALWKTRITAVFLIYTILISTETITIIILDLININNYINKIDLELILSLFISKILSYMVALIISNFKMLKANINISLLHWCAVFFIPLSTMFVTFVLMIESEEHNSLQIFLSITFLLLVNILVFYLYEILLKYYEGKIEKEHLEQRAQAYINQLHIINQTQENIAIIRHDLKFHISTLHSLIEDQKSLLAIEYLSSMIESINFVDEYAKSGNAEIDAILNYKIYEAKKLQIEVALNLYIPKEMNIQTFDIIAILGNLLDNAIEATAKLKENKRIEVNIEMEKGVLYISIANPFDGELLFKDNTLQTKHKDIENHGFGLKSVKKSIEKHDGTVTIQHQDKKFIVDILLYYPKV